MAERHMVSEKQRLDEYAKRYSGQPFVWGYNDCFLFCLRWADMMRGENVRAEYDYRSKSTALRILKQCGRKTAPELFNDHYLLRAGNTEIGDLVEYVTPDLLGGCGIYAGNDLIYTINHKFGVGLQRGVVKSWAV